MVDTSSHHNMGIEVDQYRESIGKYYTVACSVKKCKLLSITDIACFNLLLLYGTQNYTIINISAFLLQSSRDQKKYKQSK